MGMLNCHVIFKSMEYELDEIRRDIKLISSSKFKVLVYKNSLVSNPMDITTKKGTIPGIFSPFYKNWMKYVEKKFSKKTDIILVENIVKERQVTFRPLESLTILEIFQLWNQLKIGTDL